MMTALLALAVPDVHAKDGAMLDARSEREVRVLRYVAACALPAGEAVAIRFEGRSTSLPGELGYAPAFFAGTPDVEQQRLVSACVLARTNLHGRSVALALIRVADLPSRARDGGDPTVEGAFFGNLFADPPHRFVCSGQDSRETEASLRDIDRLCTLREANHADSTLCGFRHVGACVASAFVQGEVDYTRTALFAQPQGWMNKRKKPLDTSGQDARPFGRGVRRRDSARAHVFERRIELEEQ